MPFGMRARVFAAAAHFVSRRWNLFLGVSAGVLLPCFWHAHIEAGDLGSHVYNAWLAELVRHGQLPGLWIVRQWNNVAFDLLLTSLHGAFGWIWAEKLAVSICVLIFFWGAFALVSAAARRAPLYLIPLIAILSYGWTFQQGFINYYLSLGLSFFALAILWRGQGRERIAALVLLPLIILAHPLGVFWLTGACAYTIFAERFRRYRVLVFATATLCVGFTGLYLQRHFQLLEAHHARYLYNGVDQMVLFSGTYEILALVISALVVATLVHEAVKRRQDQGFRETALVLVQLYLVLQCLVLVLPYGILLPEFRAPLSFLPHRLTTLSAVLICALLGLVRPRKWHLAVFTVAAVPFFALLYRDTGIINNMEAQSERLIATLPPGQRVLFTIKDRGMRLFIAHFADRSCIEHCFSYGNYEPSTQQFRVRAAPGNGVVMTDYSAVEQMEDGEYVVRRNDPPVYEIYQCGQRGRILCGRPLYPGEKNNLPSPEESPFASR